MTTALAQDTVLLVEDDEGTAELERRALARSGMGVEVASSVSEALGLLEQHRFKAVLLDYQLPDGDPWPVLDGANSKLPRIPVVIVTAFGNEQVAAEAVRRGVADYVKKTNSFWDQLPAVVDRVARLAQVEEQLRREQAQLAEAQQIAHFGSWEWNIHTDVVTWSDELYRIFALGKDAFVPSTEGFMARVHPEDRDRVHGLVVAALEHPGPFSSDYRIVRPDGSVRFLHSQDRVFTDAEGRPSRMAGTALDVTDWKELEQKLLIADRMASLGTLAAGMAHEINNPLTSVVANLELTALQLEEMGGEAPSGRVRESYEMVTEALVGAERIARIVRGLQTFSRVDEERRRPLDLHEVLDGAIEIAFNELRHRARITKDYGAVPTVSADQARLTQVFINLLVNAAHAIPEGNADRHEVCILTRTDASGRAVIEVRDTGEGMSEEVRSRIFDPFFTTRPVGTGSGLGLSLCHGIVTALGGEIAPESEPGRGTTFRVMLPGAESETPHRDGPAEVAPAPTGRRGRVLVVDDEPTVLKTLGRILGSEHDVVTATNGRAALELLVSGAFDVILCDLMMPEMTGMELHAELVRTAPEQAARMIFMTGGAFTPRAQAFLDQAPNERFPKPFNMARLRARLRELIGPLHGR